MMRGLDLAQSEVGADVIALIVKVSLVLAVAATVTLCMRRASAARRHLVWYGAIAGCLALTLLQTVVPTIAWRVSETSQSGDVLRVLLPMGVRHPAPQNQSGVQLRDASVAVPERSNVRSDRIPHVEASADTSHTSAPLTPVTIAADEFIPSRATRELGISIWQRALNAVEHVSLTLIFIALWSAGAIAVLLRLVVAHVRLHGLMRASRDVTDTSWQSQLAQANAQLQNYRRVRLLVNEDITTPFTSGFFRPAIIVPASSEAWDANRREAVLLHELAHVARGDYLALMIATVTCALFWFHPGVWYAARQLRNESESAADDCVVIRGVPTLQYATHLLALADHMHQKNRTPQIVLGMARISQLEWRLRAMFDEKRSREAVSRLTRKVSAAATFLVLVPLAGLRAELGSESRGKTLHETGASAKKTLQSAEQSDTLTVAGLRSALNSKLSHGKEDSALMSRGSGQHFDALESESISETLPVTIAEIVVPIDSAKQFDTQMPDVRALDVRSTTDTVFDKKIAVIDTVALTMSMETGGSITVNEWDEPAVRLRATFGGKRAALGRVTLEQRNDSVIVHAFFADGSRGPDKDAVFEIWLPREARHDGYGTWAGSGSFKIRRQTPPAAQTKSVGFEEFSIPKSQQKYDSVRLNLVKHAFTTPRVDTTIYTTISATDGKRLFIELPFGGDVIVHRWENPSAKLIASLKGDFWGGTRVMFNHVGADIRLQTILADSEVRTQLNASRASTTIAPKFLTTLQGDTNRFELWVPRKTHVWLNSRGRGFQSVDINVN
jgi:beta-lactamase regulating signal transducer with metallopeptidase domain